MLSEGPVLTTLLLRMTSPLPATSMARNRFLSKSRSSNRCPEEVPALSRMAIPMWNPRIVPLRLAETLSACTCARENRCA